MQILLLFVLAIATLGNCKKSHAKHAGYLIHKKGHKKSAGYLIHTKGPKKSATYLKIQESHWTVREAKPKKQGADYRDNDSLGTKWPERENKWMDTWDKFWGQIYEEAKNEKLKPKSESETEKGSWDILIDAVRGTSSNNENEARREEQKMRNNTRDYMRLFIDPKYKRRGVKWVQTTTETEEVFLTHTFVQNIHESMHNVREKEKKDRGPCAMTHSCSWTTHAEASTTTTESSTTTEATTQQPRTPFDPVSLWPGHLIKDQKERDRLNSFLGKELEHLTWKPRPPKDAIHGDYSEEASGSVWCNPRSR